MSADPADPHPMTWNPIPKNAIMSIMRMAMNVLGLVAWSVLHLMVRVVLRRRMRLSWGVSGLCDIH